MIQLIDLFAQQKTIRKKIEQRINQVLNHGQYIMGPEVFELEKQLASFVGTKFCITVSSGTDALLMAKMALGIRPGDEVIVPAFTWVSTAETIVLLGATPVFVDIDEETFNIDVSKIQGSITPKTKAIIPVGLFGQLPEINEINAIAKKYNLFVIEDAAQSFGATYDNKKSCSFSAVGCTSFFPAKPLGCYGDGGACFTDDPMLAEKLSWIRIHGQKKRGDVRCLGINGRLDTIQAAILLEKLAIFPTEIRKRNNVANMYSELLSSDVRKPCIKNNHQSVYAQYPIRSSKRDMIKQKLAEQQIPSAINYPKAITEYDFYRNKGKIMNKMIYSEKVAREVLCLPMHPYLKKESIEKIVKVVNSFY